ETRESFSVELSAPVGAAIGDGSGKGTVTNDDAKPTVSVADVTVEEGDAGQHAVDFTVALSTVSGAATRLTYESADGTATAAGGDYVALGPAALTIGAGRLTATVSVMANGDTSVEADESFFVELSGPVNADLADGQATATLVNDDDPSDRLAPGEELFPGDHLVSGNGQYRLDLQGDGNLVVATGAGRPLWATGTGGQPGAHAAMQGDGNLVVYSSAGAPLWSSGTAGNPGASLTLQPDADLVVVSAGGSRLWSSGTYNDSLRPGEGLRAGHLLESANGQYRFAMQGDGNLVLYNTSSRPLWATGTAGSAGAWAVMQGDGNLVVYSASGAPLWSSATGSAGSSFVVQDDGNLVVYSAGGTPQWASSTRNDQLLADERLDRGQWLTSGNGRHRLVMQGDGNLVLYGPSGAMWASGTTGTGATFAVLQGDGNLVVYTAGSVPKWASGTAGNPGAFLRVQDDGNTVVYGPGGNPLWATSPSARGDDYPYRSATCADTGQVDGYCPSSTWYLGGNWYEGFGFAYRNCTSWVAWRMNGVNGIAFTNTMRGGRWGNANHWDDNARALGYTVSSSPARGAIAQTDAGTFGHVAWVESVNGDGTVTIEEYNRSLTGTYGRRTVAAGSF
ncbi:MAG TPA: CHAP domain-containing protein, partial [Acidimicrobiales bacterium]